MSHMVAELPFRSTELLVEEWNLLSVVYKNAVESRRAAWRVITSSEQNEKPEGKEQLASHAREYFAEVEGELQKIRDGILALMDKNLIPSASTDESKVLYYKMKSNYYRYLAECATDDAKGKATEGSCAAYAEATKIAEKDLVVTHPVRLAMALSSVVGQRQISIDQTVQKTVETPQLQRTDRVTDGLVVQIEHVPKAHVVEKTVEIPQLDVVEKIVETPETQTFQGTQTFVSFHTTEQTLDVPVPEMIELPTIVSQDRIQQRPLEQIVDTPVPQIVEELAEASSRFSPRTGLNSVFEEQTIEPPAISLVEKVVEVPDIQMQGRASPTAHSSRVRATVAQIEGRQSKNAQRESILTQSDMPVVVQRQVSMVQKAMEAPQMQVVLKTVEDPQLQIIDETADGRIETPEIQTVRGTQTSKSLGVVPEHQPAQAEPVKVDKIGAPLSAESASPISVTASVLENPTVVVRSIQPVPTAEYVAHAHALMHALGAPVVESPVCSRGAGLSHSMDPGISVQNKNFPRNPEKIAKVLGAR